jgi:ankyrin repeat protein
MRACAKGDHEAAMKLLDAGANVNVCDSDGQNALMLACYRGPLSLVRRLLEMGSQVKTPGKGEADAIWGAASASMPIEEHVEMLELLASKGCNINTRGSDGWTCLSMICDDSSTNVDVIRALVRLGANINVQKDGSRTTPVMIAAAKGNAEAVRALVQLGADLTIRETRGMDAASYASYMRQPEMARLIRELERGRS